MNDWYASLVVSERRRDLLKEAEQARRIRQVNRDVRRQYRPVHVALIRFGRFLVVVGSRLEAYGDAPAPDGACVSA